MFDLLVLVALSLAAPSDDCLTFAFVGNTGPLPGEDEGWRLVRAGRCADVLGNEFDVEDCGHFDEGWSLKRASRTLFGQPYTVSLFVDLNRLSLVDVLTTMNRIRANWDTKKKGLFVFRLARCEENAPTAE